MSKLILLLLFSSVAQAGELQGMKPRSVGLELEYYDTLRDPYTPEDNGRWYYGTALSLDLQLAKWKGTTMYYAPLLHFRSTKSQVRHGGLYYELGFEKRFGERMQMKLYKRHHSQHVFERERGSRAYPLLDSTVVEVEWRLP